MKASMIWFQKIGLLVACAAAFLRSSVSLAHIPLSDGSYSSEPDLREALTWWPEQRNGWTPIGRQSHLLRFDVTWNVSPTGWLTKPYIEKYQAGDWHVNFHPGLDGSVTTLPKESSKLYHLVVNNVRIIALSQLIIRVGRLRLICEFMRHKHKEVPHGEEV